ncbi:hypothetical protein [Ichthyobacterium seriolicida]|uniref:DUF1735 domain-containing protein n=1 Tax=Ichthyobacterium seriolicida TaxID=242600 RepID=A0A1J1DZ05_9FLAO|nr:hypothetical protein [Ichthyobacterium seriolicida]BAV95151.1 hypothetical protein JBKA6_1138 [Ichthyobacterium seriolicida]
MKKKILKNILSLLTLGLVVFSCNKPSEGPKTEEEAIKNTIANIKRIVFTKAKNSTGTPASAATSAYAALFVKKTPAVTYADLDTEFPAAIQGDTVIKVTVPFDKTLNISTAATLTATITLNEKPGENVYLGDKKLTDSTAPFDYPISTQLVHANLIESTGGVSQVLEIKRKDKDGKVLIKKSFKVVFIHDAPSNNAIIGPDDFKFTVAASGANLATSFRTTTNPARTANSIVKAHRVTITANTNDGTAAGKEIEFQLRTKKASGTGDDSTMGELESAANATTYFKADALKLPDGAYIEVGNTECTGTPSVCNNVNPITGVKTGGTTTADTTDLKGAGSNASISYNFTVVAQDGTTKKHYKLTINAAAPTGA